MSVLLVVVFLLLGWFQTFTEMWTRWFPAWRTNSLSLFSRFTEGDSYYTHGPIVLLISLVLAGITYKRHGLPISKSRGSAAVGGLLLGGGLVLHLLSVYARVTFISGFALIGVLFGLLLLAGGGRLAKTYWAAGALLVFMVPLPMSWIAELNFSLKMFTGRAALWLTNELFFVPAVLDGSYVFLTSGPQGQARVLVLENICSGLKTLIALVWFTALFAAVCRVSRPWKILFLAAALPLAVGCNIVRITALNLAAHYFGVSFAKTGSWFHTFSGVLIFLLATIILMSMEKLILRYRSSGPIAAERVSFPKAPLRFSYSVLLVLGLGAGLSIFWSQSKVIPSRGNLARGSVPASFTLNNIPFSSRDLSLDTATINTLETRDYLFRRYTGLSERETVDLLIVFSPDNRKGTHPPEVCLEGNGLTIVHRRLQPLPNAVGVPMRELVSRYRADMKYHLYVYKCGDRFTPDFLVQQAGILLNGLTRRDSSGALIRLTVPVAGHDVDAARQLALSAARTLLPSIRRGLP